VTAAVNDRGGGVARFVFVALGIIFFLVWIGGDTPTRRFRERLTIYVDTPDGLVSGSSVTEHSVRFQDGWLGGLASHQVIGGSRGEATAVDLGHRGLLLALLANDPTRDHGPTKHGGAPGGYEYVVFKQLNDQARNAAGAGNGASDRWIAAFIDSLNQAKPSGDVPFGILGLFVRFRDINDPMTIERVDPSDLAASFGPGVKLERVTVEIVDDPPTAAIEAKVPWLQRIEAARSSLDGDTSSARRVDAPLTNKLGSGAFRRGM
jgi:hypothetical protein